MDKVLVYLSILYKGNWDKIYDHILTKKEVDKKDMEEKLENYIGKYISLLNPNYPTKLKSIFKPPFVLFYEGDINLLNNSCKKIAVIGSRNNSEYGKQVTKTLCQDLAINKDVIILSGLAKGIDAIAHKTCIENDGKTIAILGNGLNIIYPKENLDLYELIKEKGLILSEYPLDVLPDASNFPKRNRIIAGLCDCIVVTEAKVKSGTMNTVSHALEDGKQIFCVPDKLNTNSGCNKLIKEGAFLIENAEDILNQL